MYMYDRQSENVYSKVQIQAANLQYQKVKTVFHWLIWIFTNFKQLGHEFSLYDGRLS